MNIAMVGNCQAQELTGALQKYLPLLNCYLRLFTPVFAIESSEVKQLHEFLRKTDILITQPINDNYRNSLGVGTNTLRSCMRSNSITIVVPNCHWEGYFPNYLYIKDKSGKTVRTIEYDSPSDYHDGFIFAAYDLGLNADYAAQILGEKLPATDWVQKHLSFSFEELRKREENCNIKISDYIEKNYRHQRLFDTFNHPNKCVIDELANRIAEKINFAERHVYLKKIVDNLRSSKKIVRQIISDPKVLLQGKSITKKSNTFIETVPIYNFVSQSLNLKIDNNRLRQANVDNSENWHEIVKKYFLFYQGHAELVELNRTMPRIEECKKLIKAHSY